jgi:3-deoxy-D-manno-octulosonate 8-phosphate phosphatase (KDO 8-P phosphatase)
MTAPVPDSDLYNRFRKIRTLVFDVDGVLTNGMLLVMPDGQMVRQMNIRDGYALQLAVKQGYRVVIISGGFSEAVDDRLRKLGISDIFMKIHDKKSCLEDYVLMHELAWDEILFMGDDMPDFVCMQMVGLSCCPSDAAYEIRQISRYISPVKGGEGCARDVIEKILKLNGHWDMDLGIAAR